MKEAEPRIATREDLSEIRHLLEHSRRSFASFGEEDLEVLVGEGTFVVAATGALVWGVLGLVRRGNGWADVRAAALLNGWRYDSAARALMPLTRQTLASAGTGNLLGIAREAWLSEFFRACGFAQVDEIVVYAMPVSDVLGESHGVEVRRIDNLKLLISLDGEIFDPMWGMTEKDFAQATLLGGAVPLVAYVGGEAAGYALVGVHREICEISRLGVLREYRKEGIGKALLREAMKVCASGGSISVLLNTQKKNEAARALYEGFGFRRYGGSVPVWVLEI